MNRLLLWGLLLFCFGTPGQSFASFIQPEKAQMDTIPPVIFCPNSQIINLAPLDCDTILNYSVQTFDDQGQVILILLDGIASGGAFPSGVTVNYFLATDLAGNTAECSFTITTLEPMTQPNCADVFNVLLDENCSGTLSPFDVLEGGPYGCPLHYIIEVDKTMPFGNGPWLDANFGAADINSTYQIRVTALLNNARCWGNIHVRDSLPPVISVQPITVPCALPLNQLTPDFLRDSFGISAAMPIISDFCSDSIQLTFVDVQQNLPCDDTTVISGIIRRMWTATDEFGNAQTVEQIISRQRLLSEVFFPANRSTVCTNPDLSDATNGRPYISFMNRQYTLTLASYCELDAQYFDTIQVNGCGGSYTVRRTWKVFDACLPFSDSNPKISVQEINVQDILGPTLVCPQNVVMNVSDINCRASLNLPDVALSDNCSGLSNINAFWTDNNLSKTLEGAIEYMTDSTGTDSTGVLGTVADFPVGTSIMLYVVEDDCGNTSDCTFQLTIANSVPPVAKCDSLLAVNLLTNGYLNLPVQALDNGSTDDCSPMSFKAKLNQVNTCHSETMFSDTLNLCCHNSGDTLQGTLRVFDIATPIGTVTSTFGAGHFTDCSFKIKISGTNPPACTAAPNISVSCEDFDATLNSYAGILTQNCSVDSVSTAVNLSNFDTLCSRGTIVRTFHVFDSQGQTAQCSQQIAVGFSQDYFVRFPDDKYIFTCDTNNNYGNPLIFGQNCGNLSITYTDYVFTIVPDACFRIERVWTILNSCNPDSSASFVTVPNANPNPTTNHADNLVGAIVSNIQTPGDPWKSSFVKINPSDAQPTNYSIYYNPSAKGYKYTQTIKIIDTVDPIVEDCSNSQSQNFDDLTTNDPQLWHASYWFDPVHISTDLCEGPSQVSMMASDACAGSNVTVEFQLFLDLNRDGLRETFISSNNLPPANTIFYNNVGGQGQTRQFDFRPVPANQKWKFALKEEIVGNQKKATIAFNTDAQPNTYLPMQLPHGEHKVKWFITDGCGNETICERDVKVLDKKPPTLLCKNPFTTNLLSSTGTIQLWADDFLQFSDDNCTPAQFLIFGVRKAGTGTGFPLDQTGNPYTNITYFCEEIGPNTVELWAMDRNGNASSCTTELTVANGFGANCGEPVEVSGKIETEPGLGVENASVDMDATLNALTSFSFTTETDTFGHYSSQAGMGVPVNSNLTIAPSLDVDDLNGVTTFDLVLISKHILGIEALPTPYKIIAADANKSNSVTTSDIVELRKILLGINSKLPNNTSWRFVPKSHVFGNPQNPFTAVFPEVINIGIVQTHIMDADFIGIKVGDVNNTVVPNANVEPGDRSEGSLALHVATSGKETLHIGETIELSFSTEEIAGCQFTLNHPGLELLELVPGQNLEPDNFALFPEKKALTMSWEKGGKADFRLKCRALEAGNIREMLQLNSRITKAEAYKSDAEQNLQRWNLALAFPGLSSFELYQNRPNPFENDTYISFNLPQASGATLRIFDADGRLLYVQSAEYGEGTHSVRIEKAALKATGVLYYQLETATDNAMRKMVVAN